MAKRCDRPGCGHEEQDHLRKEHGGCFGRKAETGHRCGCSEFVAADPKALNALGPLRLGKHNDPHLAHHPACKKPDGHEGSCIDQPKSEPPPRRISDAPPPMRRSSTPPPLRVIESERPPLLVPESLGSVQSRILSDVGKRRTFSFGQGVRERLDDLPLLFIGGKQRELSELNAAANGIITETNAEDLATGIFEMRQKIRLQATEIVRLRAELEELTRPATVRNISIHINGERLVASKIAGRLKELLDLDLPTG